MTLLNGIRYIIIGEETCPTTNKTHWQCYIELYNSQRMSWIKKAYEDNTVHLEARRGTRLQARDYCKKDGKYTELGKWIKGQGHRTDLEEIALSLISGESSLNEIMEHSPSTYCQYRNGLKDLSALGTKNKIKRDGEIEPHVIVISGPTGKGKTHMAKHTYGGEFMIKGKNLDWWQDYDGEKKVIIDEYSNNVSCDEFLNLTGKRYFPLRLNVKGSHTYAQWTTLIITTNLRKEQLHRNALEEHRNAMFRRIDEWIDLWDDDDDDEMDRDEELQG